ncbi:MAG: phosphonate C-P lyase system protein PhnG [Syntrophorhabdaceae bacterium]|nr:phosphonate C-P lyase system protein PhnG [Syntrophorhabdaceae bacterium]
MDELDFRSIIINMEKQRAKYLKKIINTKPIKIIRPARTALVMMSVRDSFNLDFHLGEVLVTDAEVECAGHRGYGIIIGEEPEKAYIIAAIDAICKDNDEIFKKRLERFLKFQKNINDKKTIKEQSLIEKTKVQFQLMPKG